VSGGAREGRPTQPKDPHTERRHHMAISEHDLELPAVPASVRDARRFVQASLAGHGDEPVVEVASLLTSELVTNAIVHAGGPVSIRVSGDCDHLRVDVRDPSTARPHRRRSTDSALTGRGLGLVERLAARWGADLSADGSGKVVWFELRLRTP
jgi:anti-sigma regulatory factor (Ser/Thr protein kinase)